MKARFYIAIYVGRLYGVFDRTSYYSYPIVLRTTRKACETFIKNLKRENKTWRQYNRRRRQREAIAASKKANIK